MSQQTKGQARSKGNGTMQDGKEEEKTIWMINDEKRTGQTSVMINIK